VCIRWLKYELVLQHVHLLSAAKTPWFIAETACGVEKPKKPVLSQIAHMPCALNGAYFLVESAEKPSNARLWKETLMMSQMIRSGYEEKRCAKLENEIFSKNVYLKFFFPKFSNLVRKGQLLAIWLEFSLPLVA